MRIIHSEKNKDSICYTFYEYSEFHKKEEKMTKETILEKLQDRKKYLCKLQKEIEKLGKELEEINSFSINTWYRDPKENVFVFATYAGCSILLHTVVVSKGLERSRIEHTKRFVTNSDLGSMVKCGYVEVTSNVLTDRLDSAIKL